MAFSDTQHERRAGYFYGQRVADICDPESVEILRFQFDRTRFSIRYSQKLENLNVWLPLNYEDRFVGAIDVDGRIPIILIPCLSERSLDRSDRILRAALAAYDQHRTTAANR